MFSFFSKKKTSPEISPSYDSEPIPGINSSNGNDDFTIIDRHDEPQIPSHSMYPPMPQPPNYPYLQRQQTLTPISYLNDVPFILSPIIAQKTSFKEQQSQIDGILALMTRSLIISNSKEYDFSLERSIADASDAEQ